MRQYRMSAVEGRMVTCRGYHGALFTVKDCVAIVRFVRAEGSGGFDCGMPGPGIVSATIGFLLTPRRPAIASPAADEARSR